MSNFCYNRSMKPRNAITLFSRMFSALNLAPLYISALAAVLLICSIVPSDCQGQSEVVLRLPMSTTGPNSLDPVRGSSKYDNVASGYVYETLLEYEYLIRPYQLKPCLVVPEDVFYSLKRMADKSNNSKSWWLMQDTIKGFDDYKKEQNEADEFDYDAPVSGMVKLSDRDFKIVLNQPFIRFQYTLAMFQTSILPREAVDFYGKKLSRHPVGTGPFLLDFRAQSHLPRRAISRGSRHERRRHPALYGLRKRQSTWLIRKRGRTITDG